jgi:hypothetical protein
MSYGGGNRGNHAWSPSEEESRRFIKKALEAGTNFFDTANRHSLGNSEEILGRAIKDFARRDEFVIATKVYGRMRPGPNGAGLSRKAILGEIDMPIEETLEALDSLKKASCEEIFAERERQYQQSYRLIPALDELCACYGDAANRKIYIMSRDVEGDGWTCSHAPLVPDRPSIDLNSAGPSVAGPRAQPSQASSRRPPALTIA